MRALVTGGTGLVGRSLVGRLVASGHEVVCMVRRPLTPAHAAITVIQGDLLRPETIDFAEAGAVDAVFHLGALLPAAGVADASYMIANAAGTAAVVEAALKQGASRFVYLSSVSVYAGAADEIIRDGTPPSPRLAYAVSKLSGELCLALAERHGATATSFRVSSIYGPGMPTNSVLPRFIEAALRGEPFGWLGTGARAQDFIHAEDVADACIAACGAARSGVAILASGAPTSMKALAEAVAARVPGACATRMGDGDPGDARVWLYDAEPAREAFGLAPARGIGDGLDDIIAAWRSGARGPVWWQMC